MAPITFLDLPREIRDLFYQLMFPSKTRCVVVGNKLLPICECEQVKMTDFIGSLEAFEEFMGTGDSRFSRFMSIFGVNHQVRAEALEVFENNVKVRLVYDARTLLLAQSKSGFHLVDIIHIERSMLSYKPHVLMLFGITQQAVNLKTIVYFCEDPILRLGGTSTDFSRLDTQSRKMVLEEVISSAEHNIRSVRQQFRNSVSDPAKTIDRPFFTNCKELCINQVALIPNYGIDLMARFMSGMLGDEVEMPFIQYIFDEDAKRSIFAMFNSSLDANPLQL